jgi:predicted DNA-binding protein
MDDKTRVAVYIDRKVYVDIKVLSAKTGKSMSYYFEEGVKNILEQNNKPQGE